MSSELVKELIDAGVHFGHRASRWNPKMKPYIFGKRNLIHIINIKETLKGLLLAKKFIARIIASNKDILFVGTKRQARKSVEENALRVNQHFVNDRWLGGTLTNFHEIRKRVARLDELEKLETEGMLDTYSKKEGSSLRREVRKIRRNLQGIRRMTKMPGVLFIIDQKREIIAVREAAKLGIPVIALLDTDGDPDMVDIPIPGNDDAMRSIEIIVKELCDAAAEGMNARTELAPDNADRGEPRRRSARPTMARASDGTDKPGAPEEPAAPAAAEPPTGQNPA